MPAARATVSARAKMSALGKQQYCCREKINNYRKGVSSCIEQRWVGIPAQKEAAIRVHV